MTLKPPTRTFPKLVMKDLDEDDLAKTWQTLADQMSQNTEVPVRGDCGDIHRSLKERLECAACNHAIATNSRPWIYGDKALSDFTRVLEGVEGQKRPQKEKSRDE